MQRIQTVDINTAPEASKPILQNVKAKFGRVPNIFASLANSPVALEAVTGLFAALDKGVLAGKTHEAIALRTGEVHGCRYCTAAHTAKAKMAGATVEETIRFRKGEAEDPKVKAMLDIADTIVQKRGQLTDEDVQAARDAGVTDAELLEVLAIVVLNTFTNYVNALVQTELDFPAAPPLGG